MKILILANNDVGLYQFRRELIEKLLIDNIVTISLPYGELIEPLKKMGCSFVDISINRRGVNPFKDLGVLKNYFHLIKNQKPDQVITYTIKPNVYGGLVCRLLKVSYAINITGLGTAFQRQGWLRKLVETMYKVGLKKAKVVFFENEENRQIFIKAGIVSKKQACLLNGAGVNLDHYSVAEYPEDDGIIRFLFIGRVMREKGIDELFSAMQALIEEGIKCSLDVLGGCEEKYEDKIKKFETDGWLNYHGYQKDVRLFIKRAQCCVLPSWHEGMANTNLECAASGRPIITSNIHGCKEAVIDGVSGFLCEPRSIKSLYDEMKRFTELSYAERKNMGIAGRQHMEKYFDKKKIVEETIKKLSE